MNLGNSLNIVLNPNAREPRRDPPSLEQMKHLLGAEARIHVTKNLDHLDELMREWNAGDETLCFYGGDGSIARGLTSFIRHKGEDVSLPPVLSVRAGTINMLCSILGVHERPIETFKRWRNRELLTLREIPMIKVEIDGEPAHYGFVLAWGIGYRVVHDYYSRSAAPDFLDGIGSLTKAVYTAIHPKGDRAPLLKAEDLQLKVDGKHCGAGPLRALTLGTIPRLSLGMRPFARSPVQPGHFHFTGHGISRLKIVRHLTTLGFGVGDVRKLDLGAGLVVGENVSEVSCVLTEGFTMDGEMFELSRPTRTKISAGPVVRFFAVN